MALTFWRVRDATVILYKWFYFFHIIFSMDGLLCKFFSSKLNRDFIQYNGDINIWLLCVLSKE